MTLKREAILTEALPYIQEFHNSIMVIKIGGHAIIDPEIMDKIMQNIVLLRFVGICPILVHGGGPEITEKMNQLGKKPKFISGLRITDDETLEITRMVLVGNINTKLVSLIGKHGGKGVGLSGKDGKMITAIKKPTQKVLIDDVEHEMDLGWVGDTKSINPDIIHILIDKGYIPVISPIAMDKDGNSMNINADTVASSIAISLKAKKLILMTDVPGVLKEQGNIETRISQIAVNEVDELIKNLIITGGMIPKIQSAAKAVSNNVEKAHIIDGSASHSILLELFTDIGIGTMVYDSHRVIIEPNE
ncbi:MAG: acetylglutamate kinase [Methanosarcinaceae archaeon]|jgi:acetylglutamate kinase|nr:acetylglutamate kinase [Methanosarcinaceae archaeon]NKQ38746.1 acetylglutamate kinase [Methanosarcinales archaeon]